MTVLYSRYQDAARPIRKLDSGWQLLDSKIIFPTAQSLLKELTGHPLGRKWSADRYFQTGKYEPKLIGHANIIDWFKATPHFPTPIKKLGIDLERRSDEVRKLLWAGFGPLMLNSGYDPEEVLQEVYRGILARNAGKCLWDETKSSFGHYVHMVCGCVLSNFHRKQKRRKEFEQVGVSTLRNEEDAVSVLGVEMTFQGVQGDLCRYLLLGGGEGELAARILPDVVAGVSRKEIAARLGVSPVQVGRAYHHLKEAALRWHSGS